jgi:hypothetical protein
MADSNLSLPEYGTTLNIGTGQTLGRQGSDGDASRHGTGSAAIREHSGRLSENKDTKSALKLQTYFIHAPLSGRVKIGKSASVQQRFRDLSRGSPETLVLLGALDGDTERQLHERFGEWRVKGEWFKLAGKLQEFVRLNFLGYKPGTEFIYYTLDHKNWVGGVPGRVTLDHVWGVRP